MRTRNKRSLSRLRARLQNRTAILIIVAGALCGSFFVDVTQMIRGVGFTDRAIRTTSVIPYEGRTWVAYTEPIVPLTIIANPACEDCQLDALVAWLQYTVPTVRVHVIDYKTTQGQAFIERYNLVQIPSVIFDATIAQTNFFTSTQRLFALHTDRYIFDLPVLDIVPVQYIHAPRTKYALTSGNGVENDATTITLLGNFACVECMHAHASIVKEISTYVDSKKSVRYAFVSLPMSVDDLREERAIEAAYCASAQDVFVPYISELFATQRIWRRSDDDGAFVRAVQRTGVTDVSKFQSCLVSAEFRTQREHMTQEAKRFGTPELPLVFIDDDIVEDMSMFADILADTLISQ